MSNLAILFPVFAMVGLTAVIWIRMYMVRIGEMRHRRIEADSLATSYAAAGQLQNVKAADNFRNLFEVPVLFYTLCLGLFITGLDDRLLLAGCWLYVLLRVLHSMIHVTYNRVIHRFSVHAASTLLLFALWGWFLSRAITIY